MHDAESGAGSLEALWIPSYMLKQPKSKCEPSNEREALTTICQHRIVALRGNGTVGDEARDERAATAKGWVDVLQATATCIRDKYKDQGYDLGLIWAILTRLLMDVFGEGGLQRLRAVVGDARPKQYEKKWMPTYGALGPTNRFMQVKDPALQNQLRTICTTYNMLWKIVGEGGKLKKKDKVDNFKEEQLSRMLSARFVRELKLLKRSVETVKGEEYDAPVVRAMLQVIRPVKMVAKGKKPRNTVNRKATFDSALRKMLLGGAKGVSGMGYEGEKWLVSGKPKFEGEIWNLLLVVGGGAMVSMARREWVEKL
jgi:hypothetical protein